MHALSISVENSLHILGINIAKTNNYICLCLQLKLSNEFSSLFSRVFSTKIAHHFKRANIASVKLNVINKIQC